MLQEPKGMINYTLLTSDIQSLAGVRKKSAIMSLNLYLKYYDMVYFYIPVHVNTALLSSHRGCSKDKIRPTSVLRHSTKLSLLLFRQF